MNKRLQQFLDLENLTPARLADILGVQRSGMSHILSGRNKPGFDFIHKLLTKYPNISADWFITGKGKPYKETTPTPSTTHYTPQDYKEEKKKLPGDGEQNDEIVPITSSPLDFDSNLFDSGEIFSQNEENLFSDANIQHQENTHQITDNKSVNPQNRAQQLNENQIFEKRPPVAQQKRSIKRVILFYSDGSFEELFPSPVIKHR